MEIARISKGDFGKRHCNTEMSTVIPINLKSAVKSEEMSVKMSREVFNKKSLHWFIDMVKKVQTTH